jgi:hypothetical protein
MIFGGGGYLLSNVARCWVKVLSVFLEKEISAKIPDEWQKYYKSLTRDEVTNIMNEQEEEFLNPKAEYELRLILDELERTTCINKKQKKNR